MVIDLFHRNIDISVESKIIEFIHVFLAQRVLQNSFWSVTGFNSGEINMILRREIKI